MRVLRLPARAASRVSRQLPHRRVLASRGMATFELSPRRESPRGPGTLRRAGTAARAPSAPETLAGALVVLVLYAACAHGAVQGPDEARLQVVFALVAALAGAFSLWTGKLRFAAEPLTWGGVVLLAAFAVWSGVSVIWSVAPQQTWLELNRYLVYVVALGLGIALGASSRRSQELIVGGFLTVVIAVTLYALGQKLLPGLHVPGVFSLDRTSRFSRLQDPFGYWNALALFVVMGAPCALMLVVERSRPQWLRLAALVSLELMLLTIAFTYSRGGVVVLVLGLAVAIALCGERLRSLTWLALTALAMLVPLLYGLISHSLGSSHVSLASRELAGVILLGLLLLSIAALLAGGRRLLGLESTVSLSRSRTRATVRGLVAALAVVVVIGLLALTFSSRGLTGTISHTWHGFTAARSIAANDPSRLGSADSGNRVLWWKEALGAFSDSPIKGWGAGSFPVLHLLYRRNTLPVKQPHSVPLQWLAETGLIGALLATASFVLLLTAAVRAVRRARAGRERLLGAALLAAGVAYAVHACYDWDSDIPGVTLPALILLGVLLGYARIYGRARARSRPSPSHRSSRISLSGRLVGERRAGSPRQAGSRLLGIVALSAAMCCLALSAALPSIAADKASTAFLATANAVGTVGLDHPQSLAIQSSRLDPFSVAGLEVESRIATRRGDYPVARIDLLRAVRRDPSDEQSWAGLALINIEMGEFAPALSAAKRALALDPEGGGGFAAKTASLVMLLESPPEDSATSTATPVHSTPAPPAPSVASIPRSAISAPRSAISTPRSAISTRGISTATR